MNRRAWAVTKREYIERVRTRWFLISTLALPVVLAGLIFLPEFLVNRGVSGDRPLVVGVLDLSGRLNDELGDPEGWLLEPLPDPGVREDAALRDRLLASDRDGLLIIGTRIEESGEARLLTRRAISNRQSAALRDGIRRGLVSARLRDRGIEVVDTERLLQGAELRIVQVSDDGSRSREAFQVVAMMFAVVTYMMFLVYGQLIVRAVLEEKTSMVVEVMVSSVRPWELMLGKMFGVGAVGLTQIGIWTAVAGLAGLYGLPGAAAALAAEGIDLRLTAMPLGLFIWALIYFVLGYLLYAGLFLAAGASLSSEQDAPQVVTPLVIIIVVGFLLVIGVIESPDSPWAVLASLIPLFSPMIVPARLAISQVAPWELAVSIVLLVLGLLGSAWLAGRIYRVGILMRGKRPNLPELVRWVRHGG